MNQSIERENEGTQYTNTPNLPSRSHYRGLVAPVVAGRVSTVRECYGFLTGLLDLEPTAGVGYYGMDSERREPGKQTLSVGELETPKLGHEPN